MYKLISGKIDRVLLVIIGFTVIILAAGTLFAFFGLSQEEKLVQYSKDSEKRPIIKVETRQLDFGDMKVSDEKTEEVVIENSGSAPLQLTDVSTSCGCTFAQFVIDGKSSPIFEMHKNPSWIGTIESGKKAILKATYKPSIMPVQGKVDRIVFVVTNDPNEPKIEIHIKANVS